MLSLAMIVKNEARTVRAAVESLEDAIDEIIVGVDITSNDGTREVLEDLGATTFDIHLSEELALKKSVDGKKEWGFSKARNQVLRKCDPANWRVILDGHETIRDAQLLKAAVCLAQTNECDGIQALVYFEPDAFGVPTIQFGSVRVLAPSVRYVNPLHNVPLVERPYVAHEVIVEHHKSQQATEDREARDTQRSDTNIAGFLQELKEKPTHARSWFYLGVAYMENGQFAHAVPAFEKCLAYSRWDEERWQSRVNIGTCKSKLCDMTGARNSFVKAISEFPARAEAYYHLGFLAYQQKNYYEAEVWLAKCVEMPLPVCKLFVSTKIYLVDRYDLLSMVYHHMGRYLDAVVWGNKALVAAPVHTRIQRNVELWNKELAKVK